MESPYFPYGIYSYLLTGRDSGLIKTWTPLGNPMVLVVLKLVEKMKELQPCNLRGSR